MKFKKRIAGLCAALCLTLPVSAYELAHSGGTIKLPATASKIVTYDLAVLDSLHTLGIAVLGVPKSNYQGSLAGFNSFTPVGSLFEPDYQALETLNPDLIFAGRRSLKEVPKLAKLAPTATLENDPLAFLESFRRNTLALAESFQKKDQAQKAIDIIDANVLTLHAANQGKSGAFLFVIRDNVIAHAPGDRFGYAYELAGLKSVLPAKNPKEPVVPRPEAGSPEAIAAAAARAETITAIAKAEPDWLIVLDRGAINDGEKTAQNTLAKHPELSQTRAYKEGRVFYVDPNAWYIVGDGLTNLQEITNALLAAMK